MHTLLAQDPDTRYLRMWETHIPVPPPQEGSVDDPRIDIVDRGFESLKIIDAGYIDEVRKYHSVHALGVEEQLMIAHGGK